MSTKSNWKTPGSSSEIPPSSQENQYPDPNLIPYRTKKSLLVHFFSIPAKIWRLIWSPMGGAIIWIEHNHIPEKLINFFLNDERTGGFYPIVSFGGSTGAAGGITIFHNDLFNKQKKLNFNFFFNSLDNNITSLSYVDSSLAGSHFYLSFWGNFFNDSDENHFVGGNKSTEEDETSYATKQGDLTLNLGYALRKNIGYGFTFTFKRARIKKGQGEGGDLFPADIPGFGTTSLFSAGSHLVLNFRKGWPRTLSGTVLIFTFQYNRELNGNRFEYSRWSSELQQFLSPPFLARNRRLAIRARLEKMNPIGGKEIPFYELSMLGDAFNLRGFDQNRFRGKGSLLINLEYRYPIWDTWDAVLFIDEGQVFDEFSEIDFGGFHFAAGFGMRIMTATGFVVRLELGISGENVRAIFQPRPNF